MSREAMIRAEKYSDKVLQDLNKRFPMKYTKEELHALVEHHQLLSQDELQMAEYYQDMIDNGEYKEQENNNART